MPDLHRDKSELTRRRFLKVMVAGAAGALVVSCGPAATPTEEATDATTAPEGEGGGDAATATLLIGWSGAPSQLDPINASADVEIAFLNAVYDYLIDTNADNELVPRLATDWTVSDDGTVYTLTLAEGVTFHNGDAFSSADVIWTLNRLSAEDAPTADLFSTVTSIEADGDNAVTITLSEPNPDFLFNLSDNRALILQENAEDIGNTFNGTGPFRLQEYVVEDRAILEANEEYFDGAPNVAGLEFVYFGDGEAAVNALRSGTIDGILRMDNATFLSLSEDDLYGAIDVATNGHDLVRLRADREPGDDPRVRLAFKHATNRQAVFERTQFGFGALGRDTPIGPLYSRFYTEEFPLPEHDPERARELLAEAGYEDGLEMTLFVPNAPGRPDLAQVLASQWAEAGINVTIEVQEEAVYYGDNGWLEVDLGITPWGSRPIPQFYLDVAYETGAVWNEAHYSNEELDALIAEARTTVDVDERAAIYEEIQRILIEDGPVIIPYFFAQFGVFAENVDGVAVHPFAGRTNFDDATKA